MDTGRIAEWRTPPTAQCVQESMVQTMLTNGLTGKWGYIAVLHSSEFRSSLAARSVTVFQKSENMAKWEPCAPDRATVDRAVSGILGDDAKDDAKGFQDAVVAAVKERAGPEAPKNILATLATPLVNFCKALRILFLLMGICKLELVKPEDVTIEQSPTMSAHINDGPLLNGYHVVDDGQPEPGLDPIRHQHGLDVVDDGQPEPGLDSNQHGLFVDIDFDSCQEAPPDLWGEILRAPSTVRTDSDPIFPDLPNVNAHETTV